MRLHYLLLFISAYLVALLLVWAMPEQLSTSYRALCLLLTVVGGWAFMRWFYSFKPEESQK